MLGLNAAEDNNFSMITLSRMQTTCGRFLSKVDQLIRLSLVRRGNDEQEAMGVLLVLRYLSFFFGVRPMSARVCCLSSKFYRGC